MFYFKKVQAVKKKYIYTEFFKLAKYFITQSLNDPPLKILLCI